MICARDVEYSPGSIFSVQLRVCWIESEFSYHPKHRGVFQHGDINFGSQVWEGRRDGASCYPDD